MGTSGSLSRVSQRIFRLWFDTISDSAIQGILRFLNSEPWYGVRQVHGTIAQFLVQTRGSLRRVSIGAFSSGSSGWTHADKKAFCVYLDCYFDRRPCVQGLNFRTLRVCYEFPRLEDMNGCTRLRSFSYDPHAREMSEHTLKIELPQMIAKWGSRLEHLHLEQI